MITTVFVIAMVALSAVPVLLLVVAIRLSRENLRLRRILTQEDEWDRARPVKMHTKEHRKNVH